MLLTMQNQFPRVDPQYLPDFLIDTKDLTVNLGQRYKGLVLHVLECEC